MGVDDDWSYVYSTKMLADTGHIMQRLDGFGAGMTTVLALYSSSSLASPSPPFRFSTIIVAVLTIGPCFQPSPFAPVAYSTWLPPYKGAIYILENPSPEAQGRPWPTTAH